MGASSGVEFTVPISEADRTLLITRLNELKVYYDSVLSARERSEAGMTGAGRQHASAVSITLGETVIKAVRAQWLKSRKNRHIKTTADDEFEPCHCTCHAKGKRA